MAINRRDLLGGGAALGMGLAATGVLGQQSGGGQGQDEAARAAEQRRRRMMMMRRGGRPPVNSHTQPSSVDLNYKPKRINKAIELWEDGQPIYYGGSGLGSGVDSYAQGIRMSQTYMDAINVGFEHGCWDLMGLRDFMRGLVDGGPTRSGHRTPSVFVETPIIGLDAPYMRANSWLLGQLLDAGVHGIHYCHAQRWEAIEVAIQMAMRYPFERAGIPKLKYSGLRGSSPGFATQIWGVNMGKYCHVADTWPLNPQGELICGVKIEDIHADADVAETLALPGLSMAEWGPGDHSWSLYGLEVLPEDGSRPADVVTRPEMQKVRQAVLDNCKKNKVMFLNAASPDPNNFAYVIRQIKDGAMVLEGGEQAAIIGREYTKRKMPV